MSRRPLVVVVGLNTRLLTAADLNGDYKVVVVEEPDVSRAKRGPEVVGAFACVEDLVLVPYQQSDEVVREARLTGLHPAAVVPGQEYAVQAAAALAHAWHLPGASPEAADVLRDKLTLRSVTSRAGLRAPLWAEVDTAHDVATFVKAVGPSVLKPANRQASVGVELLESGDDVEAAWRRCREAGEPAQLPQRPMRWRYMVEQRLSGSEYSVEALVRGGELLFLNVTEKTLLPGRHPVELGHDVPADVPQPVAAALREDLGRLVRAVGFVDGIVHSEWKVDRGEVTLIECAGRTPGDSILTLIEHAYGFNPYLALIELLSGTTPPLPLSPSRAAAIRFLPATPGRLVTISGVTRARDRDGVLDVKVIAGPGSDFRAVTSSSDRVAQVIAIGRNANEAAARAAGGLEELTAVVEPHAPATRLAD